MYLWYTRCCTANLYPSGALIENETLLMKEKMIETNSELGGFHASNGWLESFKTKYGIGDTTTVISGEAADVPITRIKAWMERLAELVKGYSLEDTIENCFEKCGFGNLNVAHETVDHDVTVEEFLEFEDCVDTC